MEETKKKACNCEKLKIENKKLKKQIAELLGKIEQLEKFIKGESV